MTAKGTQLLLEQIAGGAVGTTFPTSPAGGEIFTLSLTGRTVTFMYIASAWKPLFGFGDITVYVDGTSGSDAQTKGTATGSSAFATIQYAIDQMPPHMISGSVTINIASGTYSESVVLTGKYLTDNDSFKLVGTKSTLDTITAAASTQGSGATQGTVVRNSGTWTTNQRQHKIVKCTVGANAGTSRVIDSNDTTTLTIVGTWPSAVGVGDTFVVEDWATTISSGSYSLFVTLAQRGVYVEDLALTGSYALYVKDSSSVTVNGCDLYASGSFGLYDADMSQVSVSHSIIRATSYAAYVQYASWLRIDYTKLFDTASSTYGVRVYSRAELNIYSGSIIDGFANGVYAERNSAVNVSNSSAAGYVRVVNNTTYGLAALSGTQIIGTSNTQYSGNGTDEYAISAAFAYID